MERPISSTVMPACPCLLFTGAAGAAQGARAAAGVARQHSGLLPRAALPEVSKREGVCVRLGGCAAWLPSLKAASRHLASSLKDGPAVLILLPCPAPPHHAALAPVRRPRRSSSRAPCPSPTLAACACTPRSGGSRSLSSTQCSAATPARWECAWCFQAAGDGAIGSSCWQDKCAGSDKAHWSAVVGGTQAACGSDCHQGRQSTVGRLAA